MAYRFDHVNFNVLDLERSVAFYREAFCMEELRRVKAEDGSFILVFVGIPGQPFQIELTWLAERDTPYDLSDNEIHLSLRTGDYTASMEKHSEMGCISYENESMGLYFVEDPDGYWIEILPER